MTTQEWSAAHSQASTRYNAAHVKQVKINLNKRTDADLIEYLETVPNIQGLIKSLLRKHMEQ